MNDIQEAIDRNFEDDGDGSPLLRLHRAVEFYSLSVMNHWRDEPHYILISSAFLRYMQAFYRVKSFSVRGYKVMGSAFIEKNHAYVYPVFLYEQGHRPWDD